MESVFYFTSEYEHVAIVLILTVLFVMGLKKRSIKQEHAGFNLDRQYSAALKGMACIMILMSHYEMMIHEDALHRGIAAFVGCTASNMALVWFMFISGYGLTVSKSGISNHIRGVCERCSKVFFPMLFIFCISLFLYLFIPLNLPISAIKELVMPKELYIFNGIIPFDLRTFVIAPVKWYWFVWCILMYYIIFYLSDYLSQKYKVSSTYFLMGLLVVYYICAYHILGLSFAHYYRLTWAFFFGHLFARWHDLPLFTKLGGGVSWSNDFLFRRNGHGSMFHSCCSNYISFRTTAKMVRIQ